MQLFRYSALTFNAHRIHYDRDYATRAEGYPGLVVHGPYLASLLMDLFLSRHPGAAVTGFEFRARAPVFDTAAFSLNVKEAADAAELWVGDEGQAIALTAKIFVR